MQEKYKLLAFHIVVCVILFLIGAYCGGVDSEMRLERMAKETGIVFIKDQPYKVTPVKETLIEIKK